MSTLTIDFVSFAQMLGLSEGELAYHLTHKLQFQGYDLPEPVLVGWNKKRKFKYNEAMNFIEKIKGGGNGN